MFTYMFFDIPVRVGRANLESPVYKSIDDMCIVRIKANGVRLLTDFTQSSHL